MIQINGKKKALLETIPDQDEESIVNQSIAMENIKKLISEKNILKKIYVKNKLVNIVVK